MQSILKGNYHVRNIAALCPGDRMFHKSCQTMCNLDHYSTLPSPTAQINCRLMLIKCDDPSNIWWKSAKNCIKEKMAKEFIFNHLECSRQRLSCLPFQPQEGHCGRAGISALSRFDLKLNNLLQRIKLHRIHGELLVDFLEKKASYFGLYIVGLHCIGYSEVVVLKIPFISCGMCIKIIFCWLR